MKRYVALILALLLLCGCAGKPQGEKVTAQPAVEASDSLSAPLFLAVEQMAGFDPYNVQSTCNRLILELVLQPLFTVSATGETAPVLARGWSVSDDGMTTTVYLRNDVTFHDGSPLTSGAVAVSMQRAMEGSFYAGRFRYLDSVEPRGKHTVLFHTTKAYESFPTLLDIPIVDGIGAKPVGTGPYTWDGSKGLKKFAAWQGEYPAAAEKIGFFPVTDAFSLRDGFQYGGVSAAVIDPNAPSALSFSGDFALWGVPTSVMQYVGFNLESGIFKNGGLRNALSYAIDREAIVQEDMMGFGTEATLAALPGSAQENAELAGKWAYAPEKLAQTASAGMTATIIVSTPGSQRARTAQRIADAMTACGISTTVKALSPENFQKALKNGEFDLYYAEAKLSPNGELAPFFSSELGYGGLGSYSEMRALCDFARANSGNAYDLHRAILTDGLLCPVAFKQTALYMHRDTFTGIAPHLNGWILE